MRTLLPSGKVMFPLRGRVIGRVIYPSCSFLILKQARHVTSVTESASCTCEPAAHQSHVEAIFSLNDHLIPLAKYKIKISKKNIKKKISFPRFQKRNKREGRQAR
jgi:hypothetical protein